MKERGGWRWVFEGVISLELFAVSFPSLLFYREREEGC